MPISAPFSSVGDADQAYYATSGDSGSTRTGGTSDDSSSTWGPLQEGAALDHGWVLAYQHQSDGDRQRWFVIRTADGTLQAIQSSGEIYVAKESDTLDELPHYPTEDDARAAFEKWGPPTKEEPAESENWGPWKKLRQIDPWWVFSRTHETEDRFQFLVAGKGRDGATIYLGPSGQVRTEPHLFSSFDKAEQAIRQYLQAVQDGQVPDEEQPTGDAPQRSEIREAVRTSSQSSQTVERMVEKLAGERVLLVGVAAAAIYLYVDHQEGAAG